VQGSTPSTKGEYYVNKHDAARRAARAEGAFVPPLFLCSLRFAWAFFLRFHGLPTTEQIVPSSVRAGNEGETRKKRRGNKKEMPPRTPPKPSFRAASIVRKQGQTHCLRFSPGRSKNPVSHPVSA